MFKFQEGDVVAIREDIPSLNLKSGDYGVVWVMYDMDPSAYEATFWPVGRDGFDMTVYEEEVWETGLKAPVFERSAFDKEPTTSAS